MDYSKPINKLLWTSRIQDIADARLFYCHLLFDLGFWFYTGNTVRDFNSEDSNDFFTDKAISEYDKLLEKSVMVCNLIYEFTLLGIWPEAEKWACPTDEPIKRMMVISNSTGEVLYEAEFKSDFPLMSILYTVDYSSGNNQYKKVGYGTIKNTEVSHEADGHFYKFYDNEAKKYFSGILYKLSDGSFAVEGDFDDKWQMN